ncbi:hypothetical protein AB0L67_38680 [Streptomyces flaveolus]|uniref:hypothetical protein n=1 Tax=Streptomyces flaveolus TaxID=67297 RepID=UPI0034384869
MFMRTRARLAAVFTGLALASLAAPAAIADEGPNSLASEGVEALGVVNPRDGMDTFGVANLVITDLVNDPVNEILSLDHR